MRAPDNRLRDPEERLREVVEAASEGKRDRSVGRPGRALNRRSPFFIGMSAAAGVAVTYGVVELIIKALSVLILIGVALFLAAGLDPHWALDPVRAGCADPGQVSRRWGSRFADRFQ